VSGSEKHLRIASPLGFCNGVRRALDTVEALLQKGASPLFVLHEIVHNNFVVDSLKARGVRFADTLEEVPEGAELILSAHGTTEAIFRQAAARCHVTDATCPLVSKVQQAAVEAAGNGERVIFFGHLGHPETEGVLGHVPPGSMEVVESPEELEKLPPDDGRQVCILSQTTLDADEVALMTEVLRKRFRKVRTGAGICYATGVRQEAVRKLAPEVQYMLILGSPRSSNSNRLREAAASCGIPARLIDSPAEIPEEELEDVTELGLSAGASVPDELIKATVSKLRDLGFR